MVYMIVFLSDKDTKKGRDIRERIQMVMNVANMK